VVIEERGTVEGEIQAAAIGVRGHFRGHLAGGAVRIHATARISGTIRYESLTIESGSEITASFERAKPRADPSKAQRRFDAPELHPSQSELGRPSCRGRREQAAGRMLKSSQSRNRQHRARRKAQAHRRSAVGAGRGDGPTRRVPPSRGGAARPRP
jgi:hypothetical protein